MFTSETLKHVRRIEITAGRLVNEIFAGQYSSTFKGRGMEFSEVREYLPGDDVRSIDWNVTARAGKPFVKKFIEERELTVLFAVDTSLSQSFGSRGRLKSERAAEITAVLAFSALRNNDKVGLLLFSDRVEKFVPPRKSRGHVLRLIRDVLSVEPRGRGTSLAQALDYLNRVQRRRAVVFLISDFIDQGYEKALAIVQKRHDAIAVPLTDPWELSLPPRARLLVEDAESGAVSLVNTTQEKDYAARNQSRVEGLSKFFSRRGLDAIFVNTNASYVESFLAFFRTRAKRFH